ncbi:DUF7848 domain-containing protein [Streptomyces gibsoniae]
MTTPIRSFAYPEVRSRLILDELPFRRWVECASCIESQDIERVSEADTWSKDHNRKNPTHDRFRVVRQTGWRLVPKRGDGPSGPPPEPAR